jgi:hypothetical protein
VTENGGLIRTNRGTGAFIWDLGFFFRISALLAVAGYTISHLIIEKITHALHTATTGFQLTISRIDHLPH